jgi:Ca-activated chloride channel family protein
MMRQARSVTALVLVLAATMLAKSSAAQLLGAAPTVNAPGTGTLSLFVTVKDAQKELAPALVQSDFEILDNDKPQPIVSFDSAVQPITVVVMLDASASMTSLIGVVQDAAKQFITSLPNADRIRVGAFGNTVQISPRFTSDRNELFAEINKIASAGSTALWNGVLTAVNVLKATDGHRVVLVTTDGSDNASLTGLGGVIDQARANHVTVCVVGLEHSSVKRKPDSGLKKLAEETGGDYVEVKNTSDIASTFKRMAHELHSQYMISFAPAHLDGRVHKLTVKVKKPGMTTRARRSYLAVPDTLLAGAQTPGRSTAPAALPSAQPRPAMTIVVFEPGGARSVYDVSEEQSSRLPQWDQHATPEPPLSMRAATQAAEAWLISRNREIRAFEASNLMLLRVAPAAVPDGVCGHVECWYYRLAFDPVVGGRRLASGGAFTVIVLMDGSVVEPRIEPAPATGPGSGTGRGPGLGIPGSGAGLQPGSGRDSATGAGTATVYRPNDDGVISPRLVRQVKPQYTSTAMKAKIQGTVVLEGVVRTDGTVGDVKVIRSLDTVYGLDEEAIKAFTQARFSPGTRLGQPVPVLVTFESTFTLR